VPIIKGPKSPKFLRDWLKSKPTRPASPTRRRRLGKALSRAGKGLPKKLAGVARHAKDLDVKTIGEHTTGIRWFLTVIAVFLLAEVTSRMIGILVRPVYQPMPRQASAPLSRQVPTEDYDAILRRNMFNVEGKIPEPFDQGLLDCFSQARPSTQRIQLLGTIVMGKEELSVALLQRDGDAMKIAVRKDEGFIDDSLVMMKIERRRICFQVRTSQELEFVELPDDSGGLAVASGMVERRSEGISASSDTEYSIKSDFLQKSLNNLNEILQTAKAVPHTDPRTGKFQGFLIQTVEPSSPFAQLGIRQGDILVGANDVAIDNPGKGLELFQMFRDSPRINLSVIRGGEKVSLKYEVRQ